MRAPDTRKIANCPQTSGFTSGHWYALLQAGRLERLFWETYYVDRARLAKSLKSGALEEDAIASPDPSDPGVRPRPALRRQAGELVDDLVTLLSRGWRSR